MKKLESRTSTTLLALSLVVAVAAALVSQSCAGGESTGNGSGSGGTSGGTGGKTGGGSGGFTSTGSGGFTSTGSGGFTSTGSGGFTSTGSGGMVGGGTGGMVGGGTGGMVGGGTGGAVVSGTGLTVTAGGFASNGTWMGYAFTGFYPATGSTATIMPATFSAAAAGSMLCAMGTVGMAAPGASGAFLGWNLSQIQSTTAVSPPVLNVTPTGTGLSITLSAMVAGGRIQIQDAAMTGMWCYQAPGAGALPTTMTIPWTSFNTMCYNTAAGVAYAKQPIAQVQVLIPSAATASSFNFCLVDARQY